MNSELILTRPSFAFPLAFLNIIFLFSENLNIKYV